MLAANGVVLLAKDLIFGPLKCIRKQIKTRLSISLDSLEGMSMTLPFQPYA